MKGCEKHGMQMCIRDSMTTEQTQKCLDKLADYEDLDERGMVIRDGEPTKCFANITFDKNDLQKMVDEKISEIEPVSYTHL